MIVDTRKRSLEFIIKFLIISNNKLPPTKGCESEGMVASGRNQNHPPLPQQPPYVSRLRLILSQYLQALSTSIISDCLTASLPHTLHLHVILLSSFGKSATVTILVFLLVLQLLQDFPHTPRSSLNFWPLHLI